MPAVRGWKPRSPYGKRVWWEICCGAARNRNLYVQTGNGILRDDGAAVQLHGAFGNGQAEPCSPDLRLSRVPDKKDRRSG